MLTLVASWPFLTRFFVNNSITLWFKSVISISIVWSGSTSTRPDKYLSRGFNVYKYQQSLKHSKLLNHFARSFCFYGFVVIWQNLFLTARLACSISTVLVACFTVIIQYTLSQISFLRAKRLRTFSKLDISLQANQCYYET